MHVIRAVPERSLMYNCNLRDESSANSRSFLSLKGDQLSEKRLDETLDVTEHEK